MTEEMEKDANVVEEVAKKLRMPRYVIRTRNLKLLHDLGVRKALRKMLAEPYCIPQEGVR